MYTKDNYLILISSNLPPQQVTLASFTRILATAWDRWGLAIKKRIAKVDHKRSKGNPMSHTATRRSFNLPWRSISTLAPLLDLLFLTIWHLATASYMTAGASITPMNAQASSSKASRRLKSRLSKCDYRFQSRKSSFQPTATGVRLSLKIIRCHRRLYPGAAVCS